jgi:hypothetical protein
MADSRPSRNGERRMSKLNAAYRLLKDLGMRPAIARHFIVGLRRNGFVLVREEELVQAKQINRKIEIIIKLMKAGKGKL